MHLVSAQSNTATCPSCGTKGSVLFSVFGRHAHVFWIPLFPIGKVGASQCQHCKHTLKSSEMPKDLKSEYLDLKATSKAPLWQFSGLVLLVGLVGLIQYSSGKNKELEKAYISEPIIGDVYRVKTEDNQYTAIKVGSVSSDSVYLYSNLYQTNKSSGISKIDIEENYATDMYAISKSQLNELYTTGEIMGVNRK